MATKPEDELCEQLGAHWLKAVAAIQLRNFDYAISLLQSILKHEPEFLTGRQLLRRAEIARGQGGKKAIFGFSASTIAVMKAQRELKKDPRRAVEMVEKILEGDPFNRQANLVLKQAALAAGWPEIAVFALQTLLEHKARDPIILHELGRVHHELGENEKEAEIYQRITEIDPLDAEAARLGRDASARASINTGGWREAESYRDLIKVQGASGPERQNQPAPPDQFLEQQIEETFARHQAEPHRIDLAQELGALYVQREDLENGIAWYRYAADLTHNDPGITQKIFDLRSQQVEREIAEHEKFLAKHDAQDPLFAQRSEALLRAKKNQVELLIDEARQRSQRNPTDLQVRFELGQHLFSAGQLREALPELQRARQNPGARLKSMNLLGCCYRELGMLDLAAQQLEEAAREINSMDAMKMEITYNLGLVYELLGEKDKSIAALKQIYQIDYGYRDVAKRVEASYERRGPDR
jgi:tetratricopeptide (TPR) repeat protein